VPGHFVHLRDHVLQAIHSRAKAPVQRRADGTLERLKQKQRHKEQNAGGGFRRQHGLEPSTDTPHQRQIEQSNKRGGERKNQIALRTEFQKFLAQRIVD
jgi:hypothetical protein